MPGSSAPVQTPRTKSLLPLLGWTLLAAFALGSALISDIREHPRRFELLYAAGFLGYLLLVLRFRKSVAPQKRQSAYFFIALGFDFATALPIMLAAYLYKSIFSLCDTPFLYLAVGWLKKNIKENKL